MDVIYLYYFLGSFIVTFIVMPFGLKLIRNLNITDKPNSRKVHRQETPSGGGLIIFFGICISMISFIIQFNEHLMLSTSYFLGLLIIFIMGFMDDKNDLSPKIKLLAQVVSATIFISLSNEFININFFDSNLFSVLFTIFFIISVVNAYNLIDGLDGLASGLAIISIFSLLILFESSFSIIFYSIIGILFAFLRRNSYPAKIFLGNTGSYMLGYSVAVLSVLIISKTQIYDMNFYIHIICVILCIGLPIIDTTYAFLRRLWNGERIFKADKKHLHHIILSYNLSHKDSVSTMYIFQSALSILCLNIANYSIPTTYLVIISLFIFKHIFTILDFRPVFFSAIFTKIKFLNNAYIYFFFSILIFISMVAVQNSQSIFNSNFLYLTLITLFINLLFILDKRTRENNNIDVSILVSSAIVIYFCFINLTNISNDSWIFIITDFIWYPVTFGIILSLFGLFKEKNDLLESPTEYLILFYVCIIMPITMTVPINLFFLKIIIILIMYKIILQDKVIREFNIIHFMNILILFILVINNI